MGYVHFSIEERCCLREYYKKGLSYRKIAELLGRNVSSVSRELRRNSPAKKRTPLTDYETIQEGFAFIFKRDVINDVVNGVVNKPLTEEEKMVLELLKKNPMLSASKMATVVNVSSRSIQRILSGLKAKGLVERIGKTKGYWQVNV